MVLIKLLQVDLVDCLMRGNPGVVFKIGQTAGSLFELLVGYEFRPLGSVIFVHIRSLSDWIELVFGWTSSRPAMNRSK
jgi:hypothetical protein